MLNSYKIRTVGDYWFSQIIMANSAGVVQELAIAKREAKEAIASNYPNTQWEHNRQWRPDTYTTPPRSYFKSDTIHLIGKQTVKGRMRHAVVKMLGSSFHHCEISAIVRAVCNAVHHIALDRDNPETHIAFSPTADIGLKNTKARRSLTFAKFIRRKCSHIFTGRLTVSDHQLSIGQTAFQTTGQFPLKLDIVRGQDAYEVYDDCQHGISSCMSGIEDGCNPDDDDSHKARFVEHHFCANPGKLGLIVAYSERKLMLRAKLWSNDDDETHFLDRIYWRRQGEFEGITEEQILRQWIVHFLEEGRGLKLSASYDVTMTHRKGEYMPYLDRADCFDRLDDKTIHVHPSGKYSSGDTDGSDPSADTVCCCDCGEHMNRGDDDEYRTCENGNLYCISCYDDAFTYDEISECEIRSDDAVTAIRIRYDRHVEITTHIDNCREIGSGEYGLTDDCVELTNGNYALRDDDDIQCLSNGDYAHCDDCVYCENSGEYELTEDCVQLADGEFALEADCIAIVDNYGELVYILEADYSDILESAAA